jgi:hypothetical protein
MNVNILCPHCQQMLSVSDEYIGQTLKCPLCGGMFPMPSLPQGGGMEVPPASPSPPPPAPPPSAPGPDTYHMAPEPQAPPSAPAPSAPPPAHEPVFEQLAPLDLDEFPPEPAKGSAPAQESKVRFTIWASPRVLPWIVAVSCFLIFLLQFFSWLGIYPGGIGLMTQNAWQAAFASYSVDTDLEKESPLGEKGKEKLEPGASVLMIFYLLLFIPVLILAIGGLVLGLLPAKLPPALEKLKPLRWGIVAGALLLLFFFLLLQLWIGFSMENRMETEADRAYVEMTKTKEDTKTRKMATVARGAILDLVHRTFWLRSAVYLHVLAMICAGLAFWVDQRRAQTLPHIDVVW